jgi:D-3-phosphoglycerate dehydrogenase
MTKPIVLLFEPFHEDGLAMLRQKAEVRFPASLKAEQLLREVADVEGIIVRANGRVDGALMDGAPRLKVVGRHGVGVDNIDLAAAETRGITVVNTPGAMTESVAEHCLGLMLALSKQIVRADKAARQGAWHVRLEYLGTELYGKQIGLVGFGRIGQQVARLCHRALDMTVLYTDIVEHPEAAAEIGAQRVWLDELLPEADVVSLHVPLLPSTRGLIGENELKQMKPSAFLINAARGPVVDEWALVKALQEGWIAGAGLDVFAVEPATVDNPLFDLENVVVTPHMASHTQEATRRMATTVVSDVIAVMEGREPRFPVKV